MRVLVRDAERADSVFMAANPGEGSSEAGRRKTFVMTRNALALAVSETDAPDIAPSWLYKHRNASDQVPGIARVLAELRGIDEKTLSLGTTANAHAALPRLGLISA